jgi:geranylgeranyl reductase
MSHPLTPPSPPVPPAVVPGNPLDDVKLLVDTVGSLLRGNALRSGKGVNVSFGSKSNEEKVVVG